MEIMETHHKYPSYAQSSQKRLYDFHKRNQLDNQQYESDKQIYDPPIFLNLECYLDFQQLQSAQLA